MTHRHGRLDRIQTAEGPEIGAVDARRREPDYGVGRLKDFGLGNLFAAQVARAAKHGGFHNISPSCGGSRQLFAGFLEDFADDLQSGHRRRPARVESKVRDRFDGLIFGDAVLQRLSMWKGSSLMR
jgi:hypothetical protein